MKSFSEPIFSHSRLQRSNSAYLTKTRLALSSSTQSVAMDLAIDESASKTLCPAGIGSLVGDLKPVLEEAKLLRLGVAILGGAL